MTISLKHRYTSPLPDGPNPNLIRPSNWNDEHDITIAQDRILGRVSSGAGDVEELTQSDLVTFLGGYAVSDGDKGDITVSGSGATWTIDAGAVTYAKMQDVSATDKVLGRSTAGSGDVEEITCTAFARSILDDADEATFKATVNLEIGTDVQAYDATLASLSALGTAADKLAYTTGIDTWAETALTAFGRSLIDDANASAARTTLGLIIGTDVQAYDADLTTWAGLTPSANAQSLVTAADYAAMRALLDLEAGTDFLSPAAIAAAYQPLDADLTAIAALTSAADRVPYFTGSGTAALATFTSFGRSLVDDADASAAQTTLGLVIGTNVQAYDAELAAIAGLTSAADRLPYFTGSGTAALATFTSAGRALVDDADASAQRTTLGLGTAATASTGTSGTVLPFLDGANKFSAVQTISLNSGTLPTPSTGTVLHLANADGTATRLMLDAFGTGISPNITSRRSRGTAGSPTAVQTDDQILNLASFGYGATGYSGGSRGGLIITAGENWTDSAQGTYASFSVTANGSTTANNMLRVYGSGSVACNVAAISTSATDGFLYVPTCAGTPTGTPTTLTGLAPIVVNTTNNKLYFTQAALGAMLDRDDVSKG